ncbi:MAG: hypothetical protein EA339_09490 [Rhodobacteraceae bacterium]|nr:MAG: hypothetical protein EA339_09490 [Paracoccaceae bacterium]
MKKIALAAALSVAATSAFAGGHSKMGKYSEPVIEPAVVVEQTRSTSGGIIVPIMLLLIVAAAVAAR